MKRYHKTPHLVIMTVELQRFPTIIPNQRGRKCYLQILGIYLESPQERPSAAGIINVPAGFDTIEEAFSGIKTAKKA